MTTAVGIRETARILGWSVNTFEDGSDVFIRGDRYVTVDYRRDGSVQAGEQRLFASLEGNHTVLARTGDVNKRTEVLSWLAE